MTEGLVCPYTADTYRYMSLSNGHTTIYCVYCLHKPQYIVSTFLGQRIGQDQREQLQTGAEGAQSGHSFMPWPCRGKAEEKPLDSAGAVTGAQGAGRITTGNLATVEAVEVGRADCTESAPRPPYHSPR